MLVPKWWEFEVGITVHFSEDAGEKPLELFASLKLYPEVRPPSPLAQCLPPCGVFHNIKYGHLT